MIATRAARLLSTFVLARLLAPEAFGLVAITNVTVELIRMLSELGFGTAYVQRHYSNPEDERRAANTIFWIGAFCNVSLYVAATAATPLIVSYFKVPQAGPLLRVLLLSILLDIVSTVPSFELLKRMQFKSLSKSQVELHPSTNTLDFKASLRSLATLLALHVQSAFVTPLLRCSAIASSIS